jgi:peptide/nickel transport system ATP-binding protein
VSDPLLEIRDLTIEIGGRKVVGGLSLGVQSGERVALVGRSGEGKTLTALAVMDLLPAGARVAGEVWLSGRALGSLSKEARRELRGSEVAMIFQDPLAALNPVISCGGQIAEVLRERRGFGRAEAKGRAIGLLERVHLRDAERIAASYPHQLSGGMRQRVMIALAIALEPKVLIADEPTTALDAKTEAEVMALLREVAADRALILISHDLALVKEHATRALILREGRIVEEKPTSELAESVDSRGADRAGDGGAAVLELRAVSKRFDPRGAKAVEEVSLELFRGETLALVGESGSGKTTLARIALALVAPDSGDVRLHGRSLLSASKKELLAARKSLQLVPQDPGGALDPRVRIKDALAEPFEIHGESRSRARVRGPELLARVGLGAELAERWPHELSGGERQRIAIARALAVSPEVLVLDEPMSSVDAATQVLLLELLEKLQVDLHLSYLLITHDLRLVARIADRVAVMHRGRLTELAKPHDGMALRAAVFPSEASPG